ncbi:MAG: hypothetical protein MJZ09_09960 [Bacteroidales bacterium]|nr:hypothetical protein [Bacteroidales bacterium]
MKKIAKIAVMALAMILLGFSAGAQQKKNDFQNQFLSEKIAFITSELCLTPEEAQVFWPVYNQIDKEIKAKFEAVMKTYRTLAQAVESNKSQKEIEAALDAYTKAVTASRVDETVIMARYEKVLPVEKVAKLYVAEEKFRKMQVHRLRDHSGRKELHDGQKGHAE